MKKASLPIPWKSLLFVAASGGQAAGPLLILPMQLGLLGLGEYGRATLAQAWAGTAGLALSLGVADAIMRRYFQNSDDSANGVAIARWLALITPLLLGPIVSVAVVIGYFATPVGNRGGLEAVFIGILGGVAMSSIQATQQYARAAERAFAFALSVAMVTVFAPLLGLGMVLLHHTVAWYLPAWLIGLLVSAVLGQILAGSAGLKSLSFSRMSELVSALRLGVPVLLHTMVGSIVLTVDRTVLALTVANSEVGKYQIAYMTGMSGTVLLVAINNVWAPSLFRSSDDGRWHRHRTTSSAIIGISVLLTAGIIVGAGPLVGLLGGNHVTDRSVPSVAIVFALGVIPQVIYLGSLNAIYFMGYTGQTAARTVSALVVQTGVSVFLIQRIGIWGPAIAFLGSQCVQALLLYRLARSRTPMKKLDPAGLACLLSVLPAAILVLLGFNIILRTVFLIPAVLLGLHAIASMRNSRLEAENVESTELALDIGGSAPIS